MDHDPILSVPPATGPASQGAQVPAVFLQLTEIHATAIDHRLGYFRCQRYVIFGFCPAGGEVVWKDGLSYGFGAGGWQTFLYEIIPTATRHGVFLGNLRSAGTHVLVMDRVQDVAYAAPRAAAEAFLAAAYGQPVPSRACLCSLTGCDDCPMHSCILHPSRRNSGGREP